MAGPRGRRQTEGPLEGHYKQGRVFRPPLLAYEATRVSDWVREDLPDLLWPALLVSVLGDPAAARFREIQELVIDSIEEEELGTDAVVFDGRLTSIESVPESLRSQLLSMFMNSAMADDPVVHQLRAILSLYEGVPGAWLLLDPFGDRELPLSTDEAAGVLVRTMADVIRNDHLNALVKCASLGWQLLRGQLHMDPEMIDVLRNYPMDTKRQAIADGFIRSSFGASKGITELNSPERGERAREWAQSFWNQNWRMFGCLPEEQEPDDSPQPMEPQGDIDDRDFELDVVPAHGDKPDEPEGLAEDLHDSERDDESEVAATVSDRAAAAAVDLFNAFVEAALDHERAVDLYHPAKHEVVCGFVSRAARSVLAALRAPHLWSGEHGMSVMRILSESMITLTWIGAQDPSVYERFQNYGRGKAKLMKQHMDALANFFEDDAPEYLLEASEHISKKLGGEWGQEFQDVNLEATFSGLSMRQMALDVGLDDEYRHVYQSASGVTHGEWWAIDDYAMQRCMNPLHLFHHIPSFEPEFPATPEFARLLVRRLSELMDLAISMLFPDSGADQSGAGAADAD